MKAAKEKILFLLVVASALFVCAPAIASSTRNSTLENRAEIFLQSGQNGIGQQAFRTVNRVENYDSRWEVALESSVAPKDVALGLKTIDGAESLRPFGARLGASTSDDWARLGLHNAPEGRFDIAFQQTLDNITGNGGRIKFNLDSLNVKNALGGNPLERIGRYTEWELQQIVRNKGWLNGTDFFLNGQKLTLEQLLELGIKLH